MYGQAMGKPLYGVDGNLLVADLPHDRETVEAILDGAFRPTFWSEQLLPGILLTNYPQLGDERAKRAHRKAYRAHLEEVRRERKPDQ
jgi:hypothetical protein